MDLYHGFDSNYRYILVAARRARQLQNGARPMVDTPSHKPCRIAEQEVQANKVGWSIPERRAAEPEIADAAPVNFASDIAAGEE